MDCEHSFDVNLVAGLVDGSKGPYRFLDPTETEDYNTDLFLKQHLVLTTTLMNVHANFLRLCFEYFFIAIEKVDDCISVVSWVKYFQNFGNKVRKEIKVYYTKSHEAEVAQKYNVDLNELTSSDKKTFLSLDDDGYLKRIDNQLRSMNNCIWHCASTVFAIYRDFVAPIGNNLCIEFKYNVSKQIADIFLFNEKFMNKLVTSEVPDIHELGSICQKMKDGNNIVRTQFENTRNHEVRVPRKCYKGQSFEVGSKRKEVSMKSSNLKSTSKKLKRSDIDEGIRSDEYSNGDIFGDEHSEDIAGLPVSSAIALVGNDAEGKQ